MKHCITVILFLLVFVSSAPAQNELDNVQECRREIAAINGRTLYKSCVTFGRVDSTLNFSLCDYGAVDESISYAYVDSCNKVRKFITLFNSPEYSGFSVHYYDLQGYLIYSLVHSHNSMNPGVSGYRYCLGGKQLYCDLSFFGEDDQYTGRKSHYGGGIEKANVRSYDMLLHTDSIAPFCKMVYQIENPIQELKKVTFTTPNAGDRTTINSHTANIREQANPNSSIVSRADVGTIVSVKEKAAQQNIEPYGLSYWYLIRMNDTREGYVFGAFLEPIERIVE